ncbi:MAG: ribosome-associated translation inhibitor RaiA [Dehalococcoidia bacterium]
MDITVRGKHLDVPEAIEERARQKLARLEHYLPLLKDGTCEVDLTHEKAKEPDRRFIAHVTVSAHGVHLQAQEHAGHLEAAVDQVAQVLSRQARREKDRLYARGRREPKEAAAQMAEAPEEPETPSKVVKVKRFAVKPMTVAEAQEQIEALGHAFFVFHHADADQVAVLYRRNTGDYGLIVPELP